MTSNNNIRQTDSGGSMVASLFVLASVFPFVSPYPIGSDVQPVAAGFAVLLLTYAWLRNQDTANKYYVWTFFYVLAMSLHIDISEFPSEINKLYAMYAAYFTFIAWASTGVNFKVRIVTAGIFVYFLIAVLMLAFSESLIPLQNYIVRNTNSVIIGYRGVSPLSTEPGLLAGVLVGLLIILDRLRELEKVSSTNYFVTFSFGITTIFLTRSGTGISYLLLYFLVRRLSVGAGNIIKVKNFIRGALLVLIGLAVLSVIYGDELLLFRASDVLYSLIFEPSRLAADSSILYRLYAVVVGVLVFVENPFGVGFGGVDNASDAILAGNTQIAYFYQTLREDFHPVSSFGYYLSALGIFFLIPFLAFFYSFKASITSKIFAILFVLFSFSIAMPIIWMMLGVCQPIYDRRLN